MTNSNSTRRFVIFANGPLPNPIEAQRYVRRGDRLICADGGTQHAWAMGLTPDVIVGDFDSLEPALKQELNASGVRFEQHPVDKDQTDLELALDLAIAEGATEIDILAVQGGRLDQSLANIMLLARPDWAAVKVRAIVGNEIAWPVRGGQIVTINGTIGDRLSLIPLALVTTGITFTGVKWPLQNATLRLGSTWGISNVLTKPTARLQVSEGILLVIHAVGVGEKRQT